LFTSDLRRATSLSQIPRSFSAAGCISVEWNGALTGSGIARFAPFALHASIARSTAAFSPAITTWPGALKFTACTSPPASAHAARTGRRRASGSPPSRLALRHRFLHRLRAEAHQRQAVLERERAGGDERRVFAEAVPGDDLGPRPPSARQAR
jgi:hypothetical protein